MPIAYFGMPLPDAGQIVSQANPSAQLDVGLRQSTTNPGRLTFRWDEATGDLVFDDSASFGVLSCVLSRKGLYRWDRARGTLLFKVSKDRQSTGSQLAAYARDGGVQAETAKIAKDVKVRATRLSAGRWSLALSWTAQGKPQSRTVSF